VREVESFGESWKWGGPSGGGVDGEKKKGADIR